MATVIVAQTDSLLLQSRFIIKSDSFVKIALSRHGQLWWLINDLRGKPFSQPSYRRAVANHRSIAPIVLVLHATIAAAG